MLDVEEQTHAVFPWKAWKKRGEFGQDAVVFQSGTPLLTVKELAMQAGVSPARISEAMALLRANRDLLIAVIGGMPMSEAQHEAERGAGVGTTGNRAVMRRGDKRGR